MNGEEIKQPLKAKMAHPEDEISLDHRERYVGFVTYCLQLAKAATDEYAPFSERWPQNG
jgi:hypothetical protein